MGHAQYAEAAQWGGDRGNKHALLAIYHLLDERLPMPKEEMVVLQGGPAAEDTPGYLDMHFTCTVNADDYMTVAEDSDGDFEFYIRDGEDSAVIWLSKEDARKLAQAVLDRTGN